MRRREFVTLFAGAAPAWPLKTTFDLIERESALSSKPIEDELNEIRKNFTPSLGKEHGRVLLKAQKPLFEKRLSELRAKLEKFQSAIKENLQKHLDASRKEIVNYYLPRVVESPPDAFSGQLMTEKPTRDDAQKWLNRQLDPVFPTAEQLIRKMELDQTYKDVTFETLNKEGFLPLIQEAFPDVNWSGAYHATKAALARVRSGSTCSASFRNGYDCTARIEHLSFARTSSRELVAKRRALLRELVPSTTRVAVLVNPADAASEVLRGHGLEHTIIFGEAHLRPPQWPKSRASKRRSWFVAIKLNSTC